MAPITSTSSSLGPTGNQMPLPGLFSGWVGCSWTAEQPTTSCSEPSTTAGLLTLGNSECVDKYLECSAVQ
jgi:hypothetical protein